MQELINSGNIVYVIAGGGSLFAITTIAVSLLLIKFIISKEN